MIRPVRHVAAMSSYALANLKTSKGKQLISLSQNESLRPPSPLAVKAAASALAAPQLYPDPDWQDLRAALANFHAIPETGILCGNGSMELIGYLTRTYADETASVLAPAHAYPFFRTATLLARARFDTAPEDNGQVSVDALLDAVQTDTRIVFVANPGNPTGTRISRHALEHLRADLRDDILLVIDEAYGEFTDDLGEPLFDLVARGNTVVLRSFSKAYGLAGLRVGWGLFPEAVASELRKVMNPNNVSLGGQAAATAALADQAYMRETCTMTATLRDGFIQRLRRAGFDVAGSFTNFALVEFSSEIAAQAADAFLRSHGIVVRAQQGAGLPTCLRVTIGKAGDLDKTAELMEQWIKGQTT